VCRLRNWTDFAYRGIFDRDPDLAEINGWVNQLG
jgi:hypothetical protein